MTFLAIGVSLQPPPSLLEFPPFAMLANGMQAGFSSLRSCCPLALGPSVRKRLTQTTDLIISEITKLHRNEAASFSGKIGPIDGSTDSKLYQRTNESALEGPL